MLYLVSLKHEAANTIIDGSTFQIGANTGQNFNYLV